MKRIRIKEESLVSILRGDVRIAMDHNHVAIDAKVDPQRPGTLIVTTVDRKVLDAASRIAEGVVGRIQRMVDGFADRIGPSDQTKRGKR